MEKPKLSSSPTTESSCALLQVALCFERKEEVMNDLLEKL